MTRARLRGRPWPLLLAGLAVAAAVGLAAWAFAIEPDRLVVERVTLELPLWPPQLDGFVVAALSDVHTGAPHIDLAKLRTVVAAANAESPDLVVLLGDYVIQGVRGGTFVPPEDTAQALAALRGRHGTVAVLGNHDWWLDGERVRRAFQAHGITVLENQALRVSHGGGVWLVGLADLWTRTPDLDTPLRAIPGGDPVILLTHSPDVFPSVPARVALTLAGHTHGGQVRLPLVGRPIVPSQYGQRYAAGRITEGGRELFVTTGIGTSIIPVRFRVPPTISLLTLRSAAGERARAAGAPE